MMQPFYEFKKSLIEGFENGDQEGVLCMLTPEEFDGILEQENELITRILKEEHGQDSIAYARVINSIASIGLTIIENYFKGDITPEGVTYCASILFRIDKMFDYKLLNKEVTDREKKCVKKLKFLGVGSAKNVSCSYVTTTPMLVGILSEADRDYLCKEVVKAISESNDFDYCRERFEQFVVEGGLGDLHRVFIVKMFPMCFAGRDVIVDRVETLARLDQEQTIFGKYLNAVFHNFEPGYINNFKSSLKSTKEKRFVDDSLAFIKNADSVSSLLDLQELIAPFFPEVSKAACNKATNKCISFTVVNDSDANEVIDRLGYKSSYARRLIWCHLFSIVLFTAFHAACIWGAIWLFSNSKHVLLLFFAGAILVGSLGLVLQYAFRIIPAFINLFRKKNFNFDRTIFVYTKTVGKGGRYKARNF